MGSIVSSRLDYLNKNPNAKISFGELEHEMQHLKIRERVSSFVALAGTVLLILGLAGVVGGGTFVLGALAAIAAFGALYAYFIREAESSLRSQQVQWMNGSDGNKTAQTELVGGENGFLNLGWFSKT